MNPGLVVKLRPSGPWRIGPDSGARNRVDVIYHSDSLYSAVTSAMARLGWLEEWLDSTARTGSPAVSFSSCFPFLDDLVFVVPPRTVWPPASPSTKAARVRWKSARFVPLTVVQSILAGRRLDENQWSVDGPSDCLVPAGSPGPFRTAVRWSAGVDRLTGASDRHSTACIEFRVGSGLWTVVAFADEAAQTHWSGPVKAAFRLLADTGFGGERSRGWGRSESPEFTDGMLPDLILPAPAVSEVVVEAAVKATPPVAPLLAKAKAGAAEPQSPVEAAAPATVPAAEAEVPGEATVRTEPEAPPETAPAAAPEGPSETSPAAESEAAAVAALPAEAEAPAEATAAAEPEMPSEIPAETVPAAESEATAVAAPAAEDEAPGEATAVAEPEMPADTPAETGPAAESETAAVAAPVAEDEAPAETGPAAESEATAVAAPAAEPETPAETGPAAESEATAVAAPASEPESPAETAPAEPEAAAAPSNAETPGDAVPAAEPETPAETAPAAESETTPAEALTASAETPGETAPAAESESPETPAVAAPATKSETPVEAAVATHPHWLLSLFTPAPADSVDWRRGNYTVLARGGRVDSPAGSGELKKQIQMVAEGSVLYAGTTPCGSAANVAPDGFAHPVFRAGFAVAIPLPEVR
jgi:CRISPR type III-A-associated RAMP protein Csm4